jgi:hypothetical protein
MKLVKSLLLGSAAGLLAVTGSMAADLPSRKAAPADYVRVCSAYGAGFFFIPGTETCLRVGGRVRAEYLVGERALSTLNEDAFGFRARARLNIDARTQTGFGTLRTFLRMEMTTNSGQYNGGTDQYNQAFNLDKAFIQFAGITAGKAQSFFDFYAADYNYGSIRGTDGANVNMLAYTASFGGGFSATLSLEDGASRRVNAIGPVRGRDYPDVVAVLRLDQSWGSAQLMGALHQVQSTVGIISREQTGYAIGAGVKLNLPSLAPGSNLFLEGVYAKGAVGYNNGSIGSTNSVGELSYVLSDAVATVTGGSRLVETFSVTGGILHYWTPQVRQSLFASYFSYDPGSSAVGLASVKFNEYRIGTNIIWSPVSGLDIGVEVLYANADPRGSLVSAKTGLLKGSDDTWAARLRIQRDF